MEAESDGKSARRSQNRCDMIALSLPFPGRRRHNLHFETAAGGGAKIDQQQNTGNYSNPDHKQQTCGSLSPDRLASRRVFNFSPSDRHLMRKTQSAFPTRS